MRTSLLLLFLALSLTSCSDYQVLLRSEDTAKKYTAADSLYNAGKYKKALRLFEQIVPSYRGKPQGEALMYKYANTFYNLEDYYLAGYQFERFESSYPSSDSVEVAAYKSVKSYYQLSPRFSLDQRETAKGLEKLQEFLNKYPNSEYRQEANALVKELKSKIEKKDYEVAKQFLNVSDYKASIGAYDNFISDHPGSIYRKNAFLDRTRAAYELAIKSLPALVKERLLTAKKYHDSYSKYYSDSDLKEEADELLLKIQERLALENETEI